MEALLMHAEDNVALAANDLPAGHVIRLNGQTIALREAIAFGHKFARRPIAEGELVLKYGQPIGLATAPIAAGEHVHVHNTVSLRFRMDAGPGGGTLAGWQPPAPALAPKAVDTGEPAVPAFMGYRRQDGRVGVRNHVLVLSTVQCANVVVDRIGQAMPEVIALTHAWGCSQIGDDLTQSRRVLEEFAAHPNVGAVVLIGLGCETMPTVEMGERLAGMGVLSQRLTIQEEGGRRPTLDKGLGMARELFQEVSRAQREAIPLSELVVATECGGSDAWSGVTANPALGAASDLVVRAGGTVILSEASEFIGAEHVLAARAASPEVAACIVESARRREDEASRVGVDLRGAQPTPGNIAGGLSTIEEKSLGTIAKGGTTPVRECLPYAHRPTQRGLVVMDTPGNDPESVTGMVAGGAQVVVFTTGRGSPTGCPIAPVIKVASNSAMFRKMADDMDVNAGTILESGESLASVGRRIFDEIIAVANGKQTSAETWGHKEFAINVIGPRL